MENRKYDLSFNSEFEFKIGSKSQILSLTNLQFLVFIRILYLLSNLKLFDIQLGSISVLILVVFRFHMHIKRKEGRKIPKTTE